MRLLHRIAVLLKADAHGVVESLEERSLLLKQYLREAEMALDRDRARLEALREEERRLREALQGERQAVASIDEDVALALDAGKDDLARFAIRRLLPRRRVAAALVAQLEQREAQIAGGEDRLVERQRKYEELKARIAVELGAAGARPAVCRAGEAVPDAVADEEVELELMRRRAVGSGS